MCFIKNYYSHFKHSLLLEVAYSCLQKNGVPHLRRTPPYLLHFTNIFSSDFDFAFEAHCCCTSEIHRVSGILHHKVTTANFHRDVLTHWTVAVEHCSDCSSTSTGTASKCFAVAAFPSAHLECVLVYDAYELS